MNKATLVVPNKQYLPDYLAACREYKARHITSYRLHDPDALKDLKDSLFTTFEENRLGKNLKPGYVPSTTFWLVKGGTFIGTGNIRHSLSPFLERFGGHIGYVVRPSRWGQGYGTLLLHLLLHEAHRLGLVQVLVTCDKDNTASAKVMEKNGAVYQDTICNLIDGKEHNTCRYWIETVRHLDA